MGSGSKKHKDKESRKRRHHSPTVAYEGDEQQYEAPKEKKHRHKKHHKEKKQREKAPATSSSSSVSNRHEYENYDSDCVEVAVDEAPLPPPPPPQVHQQPPERSSERSHHHHHHHHHQARSRQQQQQQQQEPEPSSSSSSSQHHQQHHHQNVESLSIEETNKLRAKLGLKPLDVGSNSKSSSSESSDRRRGGTDDGANQKRKDDWGEFYHKPAENWAEKSQQEKLREKLATRKEKRHLETKLSKVRTLGESDSDEDDNDKIEKADSWVDRSRKIELAKREAEKRAKMLEEMDEQFGLGEIVESEAREKRRHQYTERHLKGLKVQHDVDSFAEERDVILTLKDSGVLDAQDDVLINVNMLDDERYKRNVENKKKKLVYNAYEDQEFDEYGNPKEKSLLAQYDEEIEGPSSNKDGFKIGYDNAQERKQMVVQNIKEKLAKKRLETIETKDLQLASEYYNEEEMTKFKKPKKKAARKMRSKGKLLTADDLEQAVNNKGIEAVGSRRPKIRLEDYDIDDVPDMDVPTDDIKLEDDKDDVLEKALHRTRKIKQKESVIADIIKQTPIKSEEEEEGGNESSELPFDSSNIVLNATAEFCRTLGDIPTYGKSGNREESAELIDFDRDMKDHDSDGEGGGMGFDENVHLMANGLNDDEDQEKTGWNSVDPNENKKFVPQVVPQEVQILDEEPDVSTGMGAALKLAMSKGYLDKEQNKRPSNSRLAHLQAKHYSIEDKTYGEEGDRSSRRERYSGPVSDFKEKDSFKPNVKLEYIDDDGHVLSSKEAFRYLSHKFHGKGPGKNKIEKRLKKSVQEQLMKKMSSTDTPLGTLNMLQAKQKETQSPFVVLSGSNKSQATVISKTSSSGRR